VYDDTSDLIATTTVAVIGTSADVAQGDEAVGTGLKPAPTPEDDNTATTTEELAQDEPATTTTDGTIVVESNPPATTTSEVGIGSLNEEGGNL